ncbi:hypothetical protein [Olivibacter domesticus]|uniref:Uncharacterized protein n=1 Tax=Olivibacter domesticus TaxID=407022 RepID=A0A1H7JMN9_OLID1|nr:hypothetical protein [Olivibacter domesticus]SEK75616.1 hypothetical protein SAMN05661044_01062 [Olivibacter domesticus]
MPKRFFLVIAISFHLLCIILFNALSLLQSFALLHPKHDYKALHWVQENIHAFVNLPTIKLYSTYSGTETLFGFFAPRVGSQYITQFKLYDKTGKLISTQNGPTLRSQPGVLRYARLLDSFEPLVDPSNSKDSTRYDVRYARAILYNLSMHIGHSQPQATKVVSRIFLHHSRQPQHPRDTTASSYRLVYQQQYAL